MVLSELVLIWITVCIIIIVLYVTAEGLQSLVGNVMLESTKVLLAILCLFPVTFPVGFLVGLYIQLTSSYNLRDKQ